MKTFFTILLSASLAATASWIYWESSSKRTPAPNGKPLAPLYYQSAMHPWIKSDKPGRCTICGMELTPVYPGGELPDHHAGESTLRLTQSQIQVVHVQTAAAAVRPLVRTLRVAGMIDDNASRHRILAAYVDGRLAKLHVNFIGAEVQEGQPLADYYSPALLQAEREYRQLSGPLRENADLRLRQLGLTPPQIFALEHKAPEDLTSQILAPLGGTVVAKAVSEGQYVKEGETLFEIADFSTMWFIFEAYEQDLPWLREGQAVSVNTTSHPGRTFEGNVTFIDPNMDEATRSAKVRVDLPNPKVDGRRVLLHKLFAEGIVKLDAPEALTIPRSAVIQTGADAIVYQDHGEGAYERITIVTGRRGDELVEVLSGLKSGDKVVTQGNLLIDGQAEINRSFHPVPMDAPRDTWDAQTHEATMQFFKLADAMSAALSKDDLEGFLKAAGTTMDATATMAVHLQKDPLAAPHLGELKEASHLHGIRNLKEARIAFHRFSMASASLVQAVKKNRGLEEAHLWECPMVNEAIPGAPKKGRWIQTGSRAGANPYFGKEMQDCGEEVKP